MRIYAFCRTQTPTVQTLQVVMMMCSYLVLVLAPLNLLDKMGPRRVGLKFRGFPLSSIFFLFTPLAKLESLAFFRVAISLSSPSNTSNSLETLLLSSL